MISFTEAQAQALVTDPGTLKRGQELTNPAKWARLGRTDTAAWGECAGSGSKPYLTGIDLTEPAFKCSCPSRVFPCKHGAGLLLLLARQPALLTGNTPPVWLEEWLGKRQQTQEKKAEKTTSPAKEPKAAKAAAEAGSTSPSGSPDFLEKAPEDGVSAGVIAVDPKRLARMAAGADDLAAWLEDLMRAGLATLDQQPGRFWESQAARLVDNQLPGLAVIIRELSVLRHTHADWPTRLLARLGELYLQVRAFQNLPNLSPEARPEILQQVGINLKKEDLLATAAPVADAWLVLGQFRWDEDRLTARRTWLRGRNTGRIALVLEFSFGGQPFATPLIPQGSYLGELAFYPGLLPLRAAPVNLKFDGTVPPTASPPGQPISQFLHDYADALARQPWLREWPATLTQVLPTPLPDGRWQLQHATEPGVLPLRFADEDMPYELLAQSGGQPLTLFGEWDGRAFRPLSSWPETSPPDPLSKKEGAPVSEDDSAADLSKSKSGAPSFLERGSGGEVLPGEALPAWPQLLRIALLGTRQSGETVPPFPNLPALTSTEQQLLQTAGALALMQKAGYRPAPAGGPSPATAPAELLPTTGPKGTEYLHQMLVGSLHLDLLPDYLTRLATHDRRVPPELLVPLLQHATRSNLTRAALGPVLGHRGHWLAALNPEWTDLANNLDTATIAADPAVWETGSLPERLVWLAQYFEQDADAARALLLAALPTEPAKAQQAFLEILARQLHPDVEPLLEALLKARGQEVRRLAAELLVQIPGAALTERLWARAAPFITVRRKLLGLGKAVLEITLPNAWDKSWLLDGIEEKNGRFDFRRSPVTGAQATVGPAAARLGNLLALLPPRRWTAHLGLSPTELLTAAADSEWAIPLLPCWAQSTLLHHDADFATAFLSLRVDQRPALQKAHCDRSLPWADLAALLPPKARQTLLIVPLVEQIRRQEPNAMTELAAIPAPWPRALSKAVLEAITSQLARTAVLYEFNEPPYHLRQQAWLLSQTMAPNLDPADAAWAIQQVEALDQPHSVFQPQLHTFVSTLRFQLDLEVSLTE